MLSVPSHDTLVTVLEARHIEEVNSQLIKEKFTDEFRRKTKFLIYHIKTPVVNIKQTGKLPSARI